VKEPNELSPALRDLLSAERQADTCEPVLQARLARRLETTLGVKLPGAETHVDTAPSQLSEHAASPFSIHAPSSVLQWVVVKPLAAALVFGVGLGLGSGLTLGIQAVSGPREREVPQPKAASAHANLPPTAAGAGALLAADPALTAPATPPAASTPTSDATPARSRPVSAQRRPAPSASAGTQLAAEQLLVDQARSALARALPADALRALDAHRQNFPSGQLAEECAGLYVVALAHAGRSAEARRAAEAFEARYPHSLFRALVERTLSTLP
jgi:hypothetical protein